MAQQTYQLEDVRHLVTEGYVPFADILRVLPWPNNLDRPFENDVEHSFSLAFIGMSLGGALGLDIGKITLYATIHDFPERYAGDTNIWDTAGVRSKVKRESAAIVKIGKEFAPFPDLIQTLHNYENLVDEEACFVYALDKLVAAIFIVHGNGQFWKDNQITFEMHLKKVGEVRTKIAKHPVVLRWYDELLKEIESKKEELFAIS